MQKLPLPKRKSFFETSSGPTNTQPSDENSQNENSIKKISVGSTTQYSHISKRISTRWSPEEMKKLGLIKKRDQTPDKKAKNRRSLPIDLKNYPLSKVMENVMKDGQFGQYNHSPAVTEFLRRVRKD